MEIRFSESGTDRMDTQRERDRVKTSGIMIGTGYVWNGIEKTRNRNRKLELELEGQ